MLKNKKAVGGFSLVEVGIVVGIIAILAAVTLPNFLGGSTQATLNSVTSQIQSALRQAQSQSVGEAQGTAWGIHFTNTSSSESYAIYSGTSYASGTVVSSYTLPSGIGFSPTWLLVGSSTNIQFSAASGAAQLGSATSTVIGLYSIAQPSVSSTITIAQSGAIGTGGIIVPSLLAQFTVIGTGVISSTPFTNKQINIFEYYFPNGITNPSNGVYRINPTVTVVAISGFSAATVSDAVYTDVRQSGPGLVFGTANAGDLLEFGDGDSTFQTYNFSTTLGPIPDGLDNYGNFATSGINTSIGLLKITSFGGGGNGTFVDLNCNVSGWIYCTYDL